jgi:hypothetical protein
MARYGIADFGVGDEAEVEAEDKVEDGGETSPNQGHPKAHGCLSATSSGLERIYDSTSRPPSPDLTFARDWTVWTFG